MGGGGQERSHLGTGAGGPRPWQPDFPPHTRVGLSPLREQPPHFTNSEAPTGTHCTHHSGLENPPRTSFTQSLIPSIKTKNIIKKAEAKWTLASKCQDNQGHAGRQIPHILEETPPLGFGSLGLDQKPLSASSALFLTTRPRASPGATVPLVPASFTGLDPATSILLLLPSPSSPCSVTAWDSGLTLLSLSQVQKPQHTACLRFPKSGMLLIHVFT